MIITVNGKTHELTPEELIQAHKEQEHIYIIEDIKEDLEWVLEKIWQDDLFDKLKENNDFLDKTATHLEELKSTNDCFSNQVVINAIEHTIKTMYPNLMKEQHQNLKIHSAIIETLNDLDWTVTETVIKESPMKEIKRVEIKIDTDLNKELKYYFFFDGDNKKLLMRMTEWAEDFDIDEYVYEEMIKRKENDLSLDVTWLVRQAEEIESIKGLLYDELVRLELDNLIECEWCHEIYEKDELKKKRILDISANTVVKQLKVVEKN